MALVLLAPALIAEFNFYTSRRLIPTIHDNDTWLQVTSPIALNVKTCSFMYEDLILNLIETSVRDAFSLYDDLIVFRDIINRIQIYMNIQGSLTHYELRIFIHQSSRIIIVYNLVTGDKIDFQQDLIKQLQLYFDLDDEFTRGRKRRRNVRFYDYNHQMNETHDDDIQNVFQNLTSSFLKNKEKELYYTRQLIRDYSELQQDLLHDLLPQIYSHLLILFQHCTNDLEFLLIIVTALKRIKQVIKQHDDVSIPPIEPLLQFYRDIDFSIFGNYYHGFIQKKDAMKLLLSTAFPGYFILYCDAKEVEKTHVATLMTLKRFLPSRNGVQRGVFTYEQIVYDSDSKAFYVIKNNRYIKSFYSINEYLATKGCPCLINMHLRMIFNQIKLIKHLIQLL